MRMNRAGAVLLLAALACDSPTGPANEAFEDELPWQLLSGRIAFVTHGCGEPCRGAVLLADADTRTVRQLVDDIALFPPDHIEFAPGGDALTISAFTAFPELGDFHFRYQLYTIDLKEPALVPLRPDPQDQHAMWGWSADGRLALVRTVQIDDGFRQAITIDDLVLRDVEGTPAELSRITWSPDGAEIVLALRIQSTPHLYAISIPDGTVTALMPDAGADRYAVHPAFSPDGAWIAYQELSGGSRNEIWLMHRATRAATRLTSGAHDSGPAWSPDGTALVFIRNGQPHIIDIASRRMTRLARQNVTAVAWTD